MKRFLLGTLMAAAAAIASAQATYDLSLHDTKFNSTVELINSMRMLFLDQNINMQEIHTILACWKAGNPDIFYSSCTLLSDISPLNPPSRDMLEGKAYQEYVLIEQIAPRISITIKDLCEILSESGKYMDKKAQEMAMHLNAVLELYPLLLQAVPHASWEQMMTFCKVAVMPVGKIDPERFMRMEQLIEAVSSLGVSNNLTSEQIVILGEYLAIESNAPKTVAFVNRKIELLKKLAQVSNIALQEEAQL